MKIIIIKTLKPEEGCILKSPEGEYCTGVMLREGQTEEGWTEITQDEYDEITGEASQDEPECEKGD